MKNIKLISTSALALMLFGTAAPSFAASYTDSTHATSDASITFSADDSAPDPVDPNDPDNPVVPDEPSNNKGAELMITYASNLNFGTQSKSGTSWQAKGDTVTEVSSKSKKTVAPFVSTKDSRGTTRKGWALTVKQDKDFEDSKGNKLTGAQLVYSNLSVAALTGAPVVASGAFTLGTDAHTVANAGTDQGVGAWSVGLGTLDEKSGTTNGVTLNVPATTAKNTDTYKTTVTYELTADPAAV